MDEDCRCAQSYYNSKPKVKLDSQTTNQAAYKEYAIQPGPTVTAPKVVQKHYDPDVLQSNYKSNYTKPPQKTLADTGASLVNQYYQNKPKDLHLSSQTEYNKTYKKHEVKVAPQPAYEYKPKNTKFEGESSYKTSFVPKKNNDLEAANKSGNAVQEYMAKKPQMKLEGSSSYQDTFKGHEVKIQPQPSYEYKPKNTKFEGESSYKASYVPKKNNEFDSGNKGSTTVEDYMAKKPHLKLQGNSSYQQTYKGHEVKPQKQPAYEYKPKKTKFEGQSSYKSTFVPKKNNEFESGNNSGSAVKEYMNNKPDIKFEGHSSYKDTFTGHEIKPQKQSSYEYKPKNTKFEGESSYKSTFVAKKNNDLDSGNKSGSAVKDYMANKPNIKFEGFSSYKDNFVGHQVKPQKQPAYEYKPKQTKFEGESNYKTNFREFNREAYGKGAEYCPVHPDRIAIK